MTEHSPASTVSALSMQDALRRAQVGEDVDFLFETWCETIEKAQGFPVTSHQKIGYFRELFIDAIWRSWPKWPSTTPAPPSPLPLNRRLIFFAGAAQPSRDKSAE